MDNKNDMFKQIEEHLLRDKKPSIYLNSLKNNNLFKDVYPFNMLTALITTEQSKIHHPEGSVWNHTLLVVDEAASKKDESGNPKVFMWAALLHDLGKAQTTKNKNGRITSYDHDKVGKELVVNFLKEFTQNYEFINDVAALVRWHMQTLFVVKELPFADISNMLLQVELKEVALLSLCDRLGRGNLTQKKISEEKENIRIFIMKCTNYCRI